VANFVSGIKSTPSMPFLDCYLGTKFVGLMDLNFKSFDSLYFQQIKCHPMGKKKKTLVCGVTVLIGHALGQMLSMPMLNNTYPVLRIWKTET
jgi:hypothetical protein